MATLKDHWSKARTFAILLGLVLFGSLPAGNVHAQIGTPGSLGTSLLTNASANAAASHPNWNPLSWVAQGLLDIGATVIGKVCFIISYIISWIAGVAIAIETWLVGVILNMNVGIFQQTFVQKGFGVTLSIANLGFVLGIIIIAIATILRRETYGYKSLLWKLVVAAILVNFSLVIAAPIFNLGNEFTQYFLDCIDPSLGCNAGANSTQQLASMNNFALKLSGAFNPQRSIDFASSTVNGASSTAAFSQSQSSSLGASFGQMLVPIFSVLFVAFELIAIVIVLAVFVVQLIIRYVYIAILAILMPFAWLGWVFPTMRSWWSKWWDQFIRWTFFAPIVVFFIYLAIAMMTSLNSATGGSSVSLQTYTSNSNAVWTPVGNFFGSAFSTVIANGLNMLIMIGLTVGGMIVAQKMSISLSDTAIKSVKAAGNAVQGYVGKKTRRVVGDRLRTAGRQYNPTTRETTSWLQRQGSALQNVPGLRRFGAAVAKNAAPETVKHDREKDIQEHVDNELKSLTNEGIIARATSKGAFVDPVKAAALAQELARRDLTTDARITPLMDRFVATASNLGNLDKVTNNRPDLMPQRPGETREQATARAVREAKGDVIQVNPQIFNLVNPAAASARLGAHITPAMLQNAILTLTPAQLGALGSDTTRGSQERQNNITDSVRAIINAFGLRKPIITPPPANSPPGTPGTPTGKFELDTAALAAAAAAAGAPPELRNLEKIIKHMESSPNWGSVLN